VSGDLLQPDSFASAVTGCEILFHIAGWIGMPNRPEVAHAINVTATRQLAEAARSAGASRFIGTSSMAVYGPLMAGVIEETQPHWRGYTYAATKSLGEEAAFDTATDRFGVSVIRPAQVYGPRGRSWTTLPVTLAKRGLPSLIGGGHGLCHPVYVDNLVNAYLLAATRNEALGEAFTICDGEMEWREFFGCYAAMAGKRARSIPVSLVSLAALMAEAAFRITRRRASFSRSMIGFVTGRCRFSTEKAQRLLGWSPRISFDEAMQRTEAWLREAHYLS
jgi:nucleoside-diphosphate-sugar epimerase